MFLTRKILESADNLKVIYVYRILAAFTFFVLGLVPAALAETSWYPIPVDVWTPPFNSEHRRVTRQFAPPTQAEKPWRICVVIPHLKDDYWLAVNFGLVEEAKRLGVSLNVYEAGGYENLSVQQRQIADCIATKSDALIIGAVSSTGLNDLIEKATSAGMPVVDLINGISSDKLSARVAADFYDMGFATGSYVKGLRRTDGAPLKVAWFPGPSGAGWVADGDKGFKAALEGANVDIVMGGFGDTGLATQSRLISDIVTAQSDIDVIAGTAVTAEAAVGVVQKAKLADRIKIAAYYFGPAIRRAIKRGLVLAAPSDRQSLSARIAVDQAVNVLEKRPIDKHIAPTITLVDAKTIDQFDLSASIAPLGFRPIFSVQASENR